MGVLQSMRQSLNAPYRRDAASAGTGEDEDLLRSDEARAVVERQTAFVIAVEEMSALVSQISQLSPLIQKLRDPLTQEFEAHRRAHSDLVFAKVRGAKVEDLLAQSRASETDLQEARSADERLIEQGRLEGDQ